MYKGDYRKTDVNGSPVFYSTGDSINFHGKIYEAINYTSLSPIENADFWKYKGLTEIYNSTNPPLNPKIGQVWQTNGKHYVYYYDGNNYSWVEF